MFRCNSQQQCIMDFTCQYLRVLIVLLVLLELKSNYCVFAQEADEAFPRITPDKLQFFAYDTININCEHFNGRTGWRVMQKLNKENSNISVNCFSSAPTCTINPAFQKNSGEFWCEDTEGKTSGKLNISVTAGFVILEVPALPVSEGNELTLNCKNKKSQLNHIADFYKDGVHLRTMYEIKHIIRNVSKADEGFYKCKTGVGESPESWLAVSGTEIHQHVVHGQTFNSTWLLTVICILIGILLLLIGIFLGRKYKEGNQEGDPQQAVHAVVTKQRKDRDRDNKVESDSVTYSTVEHRRGKTEPNMQRDERKPRLLKENVVYSTISPWHFVED